LLFGKSEPSILHASVAVLRGQILRIIGEFTAVAGVLSVLFRFGQHDARSVRLLPSFTDSEPSFRLIEQKKKAGNFAGLFL